MSYRKEHPRYMGDAHYPSPDDAIKAAEDAKPSPTPVSVNAAQAPEPGKKEYVKGYESRAFGEFGQSKASGYPDAELAARGLNSGKPSPAPSAVPATTVGAEGVKMADVVLPRDAAAQRAMLAAGAAKPELGGGESEDHDGETYAELYRRLYRQDDAEAEKREKKLRRQALFATIADGLNAMSNLFFTTQYAPNAYDPSKSLGAPAVTRYEKYVKERQARKDKYDEAMIRAKQLDDAAAKDGRQWQHMLEREGVADASAKAKQEREEALLEIRQAQEDRKAALADLELKAKAGAIEVNELKAEQLRIQNEYAERTGHLMGRLNGSSGKSSGGYKGRPPEFPWYDKDGNLHYAYTKDAMEYNSRLNGTWQEETQTSVRVVQKGRKTETTTTTKAAGGSSKQPEKKQEAKDGLSWGTGAQQPQQQNAAKKINW